MTETKFISLRKRLDQLGYKQPLSVDSLPLVEKVFGDLLHTTESLKKAKLQLSKHTEQKVIWDQSVEPYKADNARLVKENNELHQQLMKSKEMHDQKTRDLRAGLRKMEHENADLKFLNSQYVQKLRSLERELQTRSEKILELQERNFQAVIHTPGGREKKLPFRRQRMDISCMVPPSGGVNRTVLPEPDPFVADLLKVADDRIEEFQNLLQQKDKNQKILEANIEELRKQVELREGEIERLTESLTGGRPPEALIQHTSAGSAEKTVAHLNVQIDFLQEAKEKLESRLEAEQTKSQRLEDRVQELTKKNSTICSELRNIDQMAEQMEQDKQMALNNKQGLIQQLESEKQSVSLLLEQCQDELITLRAEKAELQTTSDHLRELLNVRSEDSQQHSEEVRQLQQQIDKLKRDLQQREREIVDFGQKTRLASQGSTKALLEENRTLRGERERLRSAIQEFEVQLLQIQQDGKDLAKDRDNFKLLYEQAHEDLNHLRAEMSSQPTNVQLRRIKMERDEAIKQAESDYNAIRERLKLSEEARLNLQKEMARAKKELQEGKVEVLQTALKELDAERDQLQATADKTTEQLEQQANEMAALGQEKQDLQNTLTKLQEERELMEQRVASKDREIASLQRQLQAVEQNLNAISHEKDDVLEQFNHLNGDLMTMTKENQSLHAQLVQAKQEMETSHERLREYAQSIQRLEEAIAAKEDEKISLLSSLQALNDERDRLDANVQHTQQETSSAKFQLVALLQECDKLKELVEHQSLTIEEHVATLNSYEVQMSSLSSALSKMEHTLRQEQDEKKALHDDMSSLRDLTNQLNKSKDGLSKEMAFLKKDTAKLLIEIDNLKSERDYYKNQLERQESTIHSLECVLQAERAKECLSEQSCEDKETEIKHLKTQLKQMETSQSLLDQQLRLTQADKYVAGMKELRQQVTTNTTTAKGYSPPVKIKSHSGSNLTNSITRTDSLDEDGGVLLQERESFESATANVVEGLLQNKHKT